jgi:hypothetical protein
MKTPSLRTFSALFATGALITMLAGTSCDAETEDIEDLQALEDEDLDDRTGKHDDKHHGGKCDPHKPPVVQGEEHVLWPPNHKMHEFDVEDCIKVIKACDDWEAEIVKITSDEPFDDKGDGHHSPDIECDEDSFKVRAERQGKGTGRNYEVLIKVEHGHHKKKAYAVCEIKVPHDKGKGHEVIDEGDAEKVWCSDHHKW